MVEKLSDESKIPSLHGLARIKRDLDPDVRSEYPTLNERLSYRVVSIRKQEEGRGYDAWLGPRRMSQKDIDEFNPDTTRRERRYKDVVMIPLDYLIAAGK